MPQAKIGDTVSVHYTGRLADGTIFDSSSDEDALEFTIGKGEFIPALEKGLVGMEVGETRTISIEAKDAYGPYYEQMVIGVPRSEFPQDIVPEVGHQLEVEQDEGVVLVLTVVEVTPEEVVLDGNHPLAGEDLVFDVRLVQIHSPIILLS